MRLWLQLTLVSLLALCLPWAGCTYIKEMETALRGVAEYWEWPVRDVTVPLIAALTGARVGPPLFESAALLGRDLTRMRILDAMAVLGGLSKKKAVKLEKAWKRA